MNGEEKVSIIVPAYNNEGTIEACINSIREQTYVNVEIIVVNDGSLDNTGAICDKLAIKDKRIKVFHQVNKGISSSRNYGMDLATGKYLCFVDGDDEIAVDYVEKMVFVREESKADLIVSGIVFYDKRETRYMEWDKTLILKELSYERWLDLFKNWLMIPAWNKLFLKSIVDENNMRWMDEIPCGEDGIFVFEYLKYCEKISFVKETLYHYFVCRSNSNMRFWPLYGQIKMFELKSELLKEQCKDDENYLEKYQARKALGNLRTRIEYLVKNNKKDICELKACYEYYWPFVEKYLDEKKIFTKEDWIWLQTNKQEVLDGNVKKLYRYACQTRGVSLKKKIGRKLRSYLS